MKFLILIFAVCFGRQWSTIAKKQVGSIQRGWTGNQWLQFLQANQRNFQRKRVVYTLF